MKSVTLFAFLFLLHSPYAVGQSAGSTPAVIRWSPSLPNADRVISNGKVIKILTFDKVSIAVSLFEDRLGTEKIHYDKFVVYASVLNESERRVEISPEDFSVEAVKPKPFQLKRETAAHLSNSIRKWSGFYGGLGQIGTSGQTTETSTSGRESGTIYTDTGSSATYSGTSSSTTSSPDYKARERAAAQAEAMNRSAHQAGVDLVGMELASNTILPQKVYSGMLIFDRDKKCEEAIVRVSFEGKIVEFPFNWQRK